MKKWRNKDGQMVFDISKEFDKFIKKNKKLLMELSKS